MSYTKGLVRKEKEGLILFFPQQPANYGKIVCWTPRDGHNEATLEYYNTTKACPTEKVDAFVKQWERLYPQDTKLVLQTRIHLNDLRKAWKR